MFLSLLKKFLVVFILATLPFKAYSLLPTGGAPAMAAGLTELEKVYEEDKENYQNIRKLAAAYFDLGFKKHKEGNIEESVKYHKKAIELFKISYDKFPESAYYEAVNLSLSYEVMAKQEEDFELTLKYLEEAIKYAKKALEFDDYPLIIQNTKSSINEEVSFKLSINVGKYCSNIVRLSELKGGDSNDFNAKILEHRRCIAKYLENALDIVENKFKNEMYNSVNVNNLYKNVGSAYIVLGMYEEEKELKIENYKKGLKNFEIMLEEEVNDYQSRMAIAGVYSDLAQLYEEDSQENNMYYAKAVSHSRTVLKTAQFASRLNKGNNKFLALAQYNIIKIYLENKDFEAALNLLITYNNNPEAFILVDKDKQNLLNYIAQDEDEKRREQLLSLVNNLENSE